MDIVVNFIAIIIGALIGGMLTYFSAIRLEERKKKETIDIALKSIVIELKNNNISANTFNDYIKNNSNFKLDYLILESENWKKFNHVLYPMFNEKAFELISSYYINIKTIKIKLISSNTSIYKIEKMINKIIDEAKIVEEILLFDNIIK
ncbi:MAG: hypothetical protein ACRC6T_08055 [Sarcina sp.]